jgi:hypothetical protein
VQANIASTDGPIARQCLSDVLALSTLPAVWAQAKPVRIAESLASALYSMLGADFVYVSLLGPKTGSVANVAQTDCYEMDPQLAAALGPSLQDWARRHDPHELLVTRNPSTDLLTRVTCRPLGHNAEYGVLAQLMIRPVGAFLQIKARLNGRASGGSMPFTQKIGGGSVNFGERLSSRRFRSKRNIACVMRVASGAGLRLARCPALMRVVRCENG